jgi:hypothetical protein
MVVAAGLQEGWRWPTITSEVPSAREPFDAVARHGAPLELGETNGEEQRRCAKVELRMACSLGHRLVQWHPSAGGVVATKTAGSSGVERGGIEVGRGSFAARERCVV